MTSENRDALRDVLGTLMPPSRAVKLGHAERVELDTERAIRTRNKISYRLNHWPIWIWTFFLAPGPLTFDLFARGFDWRMVLWLGIVLAATGIAGYLGKLPGVEPAPYIIRFTEDRPNPLYRRICYTFAWSAVITFALLNIAGLAWAVASGEWRLRQILRRRVLPDGRLDMGARRRRRAAAREGARRRTKDTSGGTSTARCGPCASRSRRCGCCGPCCRAAAPSIF